MSESRHSPRQFPCSLSAIVSREPSAPANVGRNDFEDDRVVNFASVWILELGIGDIANFDDARRNVHYATVLAHRITPVLALRGKGHRRA